VGKGNLVGNDGFEGKWASSRFFKIFLLKQVEILLKFEIYGISEQLSYEKRYTSKV
jgi:hypothetical protein